jgi:hypothetical protein
MACLRDDAAASRLDWARADDEGFWHFLQPWLDRAARYRLRLHGDPFPGLIYSWVAYNAWLGQTVEDRDIVGRDRRLVEVSAFDHKLSDAFQTLREEDTQDGAQCREFYGLWPVFKARALLDHGIEPWATHGDRDRFRESCFRRQLARGDWSPRCFVMHQPSGAAPQAYRPEHIPFDWLHAIQGIYQVRCNLFHGGKTFGSDADLMFVRLATVVLWETWTRDDAIPV